MSTAALSREVRALIPGDGKPGVRLPRSIRDAWGDLTEQRESPSSIVSFLTCPTKWFVERHLEAMHKATGDTILGITDFTKQPPNKWSVGGTLVHRALEVFYAEPPDLRTPELLEDIYDMAWEYQRRGDFADGIVSRSMVNDFNAMLDTIEPTERKTLLAQMKRTYREIAMAIFDIEKPRQVVVEANEQGVSLNRGRLRIFGRIDRVDRTMDGMLRVVDYKTGRAPEDEPSVYNPTFIPSVIYAMAIDEQQKAKIGGRDVAGVTLLYLKDLVRCKISMKDPQRLEAGEEILEMVRQETGRIAETGEVPLSPARTADDAPCRFCPLRDLCPAWG